ncbi:MAG: 16S rRNA (guanine(527)-N(7))-methyltransferase RsmG [Candidatus Ureaplasma intestinipullorum]|uniref:Ribosomal RNA small subunit methyltransferase G n=1 Tax=Candidatus Ureaplasma intestinipullorum TaxID=2838770 RepID=A0A9E2NW76_9BACT|nr:16S rRNA (guanine(527)-N(7))-methyltransferase RsmG [Candidatus Ureaplasma intestinipullorum]
MNKIEFEKYIKELLPWVSNESLKLIEKYKLFLQSKNKVLNLTRLDGDEIIYESYFLESILPYIYLGYNFENWSDYILDIGSGSGIPGVVIKILFPNTKLVLLDSNSKKTNFLNELILHLNLKDICVVNARAEEYIKDNREKFDIVTSRAVSSLNKILEISAPFAKVNGKIIEPKSLNSQNELEDAQGAIKEFNLKLDKSIDFLFNLHSHVVFSFTKKEITNEKYPRIWSKILKNPL